MDILYVHFTDVPKNANAIKSHDFSDLFASRKNTSTVKNPDEKPSCLQRHLSQLRLNWQLLAKYYENLHSELLLTSSSPDFYSYFYLSSKLCVNGARFLSTL